MFHLYGLMIGIGVIAGLLVSKKQAMRHSIDPSILEDALLWIAIPALIGARVYHILTDWQLYAATPFPAVFQIWNGGLGYFGGLFGGAMGLFSFVVFSSFQKFSFFNFQFSTNKKNHTSYLLTPISLFFTMLDLLSFGAPLAQAIGRIGNYFNQELYGLPTSLPWGIWINGERYHPLFAYEAMLNICVFGLLNWLGWKKKLLLGKGQYACVYLGSYGLIRFWLEFLRIDSARVTGVFSIFSIAQWVGLGITIGATIVFWLRRHVPKKGWDVSLD